jgi:glycerophosphoryl diester phosphodiesterase
MLRRTLLQWPLLAAAKRRIAVISHRGEHLYHPENTIPAVLGAIEAGADYVELDVRTTSDGVLVLMHNASVDERTTGKGLVKDLSLAEIRDLDAGIRFHPKFAGTRVPTFDEALEVLRGKCGLYLDWKAAAPEPLISALRRHDMVASTVVYGAPTHLAELQAREPAVRVMPEARSPETLRNLLTTLHPRVVAFDRHDFTEDILAIARAAQVDIFVDRLGDDDNPASWRDAALRGATGIQTDKPAELAALLRTM